jgi:hypothetical protein
MSNPEKRAWIELSIVLITLAVYFAFISFGRLDPVSLSIFALASFLGFRRNKRRRGQVTYDERDRQIERQALFSSLCAFYVLMMIFSVAAGMTNGWDTSVPVWMAVQIFWALSLLIWAMKALIVIVLYRRGAHA